MKLVSAPILLASALLASALLVSAAIVGCQGFSAAPRAASPAPYLTLEEFTAALDSRDEALLVEFGVPAGEAHGGPMPEPLERLASSRQDQLRVCRLDLNRHLQLAWEFRLAQTPSYLVFREGEEVFRASHATSADHIAAELDAYLEGPAVGEPLAGEPLAGEVALADR